MNMKIIYLSENIDDLQRVYADQAPVQLSKKKDIAAKPEFFWNTEYIFSTWGMPKMTEEEIERFFPKLKAVFYAAGSVRYFAQPFLNREFRSFQPGQQMQCQWRSMLFHRLFWRIKVFLKPHISRRMGSGERPGICLRVILATMAHRLESLEQVWLENR